MRRVYLYPMNYRGVFQSRLTENCSSHRHRLNQPCFTAKTYPEAMEEALEAENKLNSTDLTTFREKTELLIFLWLAKKQSKTDSNGFMRLWKGLRKLFINTITFSKSMNRLTPCCLKHLMCGHHVPITRVVSASHSWMPTVCSLSFDSVSVYSVHTTWISYNNMSTGKHVSNVDAIHLDQKCMCEICLVEISRGTNIELDILLV